MTYENETLDKDDTSNNTTDTVENSKKRKPGRQKIMFGSFLQKWANEFKDIVVVIAI